MIGDSNVKIDDNDNFHVKGKIYEGTPGLYELLFMKLPKKYNKDDMGTVSYTHLDVYKRQMLVYLKP